MLLKFCFFMKRRGDLSSKTDENVYFHLTSNKWHHPFCLTCATIASDLYLRGKTHKITLLNMMRLRVKVRRVSKCSCSRNSHHSPPRHSAATLPICRSASTAATATPCRRRRSTATIPICCPASTVATAFTASTATGTAGHPTGSGGREYLSNAHPTGSGGSSTGTGTTATTTATKPFPFKVLSFFNVLIY